MKTQALELRESLQSHSRGKFETVNGGTTSISATLICFSTALSCGSSVCTVSVGLTLVRPCCLANCRTESARLRAFNRSSCAAKSISSKDGIGRDRSAPLLLPPFEIHDCRVEKNRSVA